MLDRNFVVKNFEAKADRNRDTEAALVCIGCYRIFVREIEKVRLYGDHGEQCTSLTVSWEPLWMYKWSGSDMLSFDRLILEILTFLVFLSLLMTIFSF